MTETTATAQEQTGSPPQPAPWAALAIAGIAQLLVMLDSTVVNVALPSIDADLGASPAVLQWVVSGYVLTYGSLLLFGGRLADALGRRAAFVSGLALFGLASLVCGVAGDGGLLVAARLGQGVGAAVLSAAALSIIVATYGPVPAQLNSALTVWSGMGVIGATIGVILGGAIVQSASWRWAFLVNLPIIAAVLAAALVRLPAMRAAAGRTSLRPVAALAATAGIGLVCYGLIELPDGLARALPWAAVAAGLAVIALLVRAEARSSDPLLPVHLLRTPAYAWAGFGLLLAATLMLGALYLSSNYLQTGQGMSPLATGFALLPLCLGSLVSAFAIPAVAAKTGMSRLYLGGIIAQLAALAVVVAATASGTGNAPLVIAALAVFGLGLPTMFVPLYTFGSAPIPPEEAGVGSGLLNTFNEAGAGVGLAIVAPISAAVIASQHDQGASTAAAAAAGAHAGYWALIGVALLAALTAVALGRIQARSTV
ncbi:MFS transporter [Luteipulveratus halotolerans]|uniref:MFS transporter n=1 Tax=Luteipulveratus halotolerans TaxID=1631356 RepID=A0A0L6CFJ9_9MICO|nr:MFS transporter [Luteipulveratus halotolerans]KNX36562.1 MFS transporter [Luteipulveratus halotolerans]